MKKISIALALILIVMTQRVDADDVKSAAVQACQQVLEKCRMISKNLDSSSSDDCDLCRSTCNQAQIQCANESSEDLTSASAHHLHCKQSCLTTSRKSNTN